MKDLEQIKALNNQHVIFAAQPYLPETVMGYLLDNLIPFKVLLGRYKGENETSFIIEHSNLDRVKQAGFLNQQESILILSAAGSGPRTAKIVYLKDEAEMSAGLFVPITKQEADAEDGWTYEPFSNTFFTIRASAEVVSEALDVTE